ncbi:outer membrane protein assembly factor BamB family protein [Nonomuraea sp. H19]|uniref:outer membrane protein assembly factor BamB family protein n=1 Tax=Nonomuraea sp. H19 TaxID=3452206 RepID=UPI003F899F27
MTLVSIAVLNWIWVPGEHITGPRGSTPPWNPPERSSAEIDVLREVRYLDDRVFGDLVVTRKDGWRGLRAERLADQAEAWVHERRWGPEMTAHVAVGDHRVATAWADGKVTLIDVSTGAAVWTTTLPPGPRPARDDDEVYEPPQWSLSVAGDPAAPSLVVLHDGRIDVLDAGTGGLRSTYRNHSCELIESAYGVGAAILVNHFCADKTESFVVDLHDGELLWRPTPEPQPTMRAIDMDRVVSMGDSPGITMRRTRDGAVLWRNRDAGGSGHGDVARLAVSDDLMMARTDDAVVAYGIADGSVIWRTRIGPMNSTGDAGVVMTDGKVAYVQGPDNTLVKLDVRTGRVLAERAFDGIMYLEQMREGVLTITHHPPGDGPSRTLLVG